MKRKHTTKAYYDKRWKNTNLSSAFFSYERNMALTKFFKPVKDKTVLDVCCGIGIVSKYFSNIGYKVWGIDISKSAIYEAKKMVPGNFSVADIEDGLPYKNHMFDVVFWGDGIEHVFSPLEVLLEIKRVLKPSGRIVISTPNMSFWLYRWHYFKTGNLPITEGHQVETWDTGHIRFFNLYLLTKLMKTIGFEVTQVAGASKGGIHAIFGKFWPSICAPILVIEARRL